MTIDERFDRLEQYILDLRQEIAGRLDTVDGRLDILSSTVANLDSRLPPLTKALLDFGSLSAKLVREQSGRKDTSTDLVVRVRKLEEMVSKLIEPAA
jgi:hypothetical protein